MVWRVLSILCGISLLYSCTRGGENMAHRGNVSVEYLPEIEYVAYNDEAYIDSCRYIALETTDESLIGSIGHLVVYREEFYLFDKNVKQILRFGKDGKFLCRYGQKGSGPGEYASISAFYVDPYREEVGVFDPATYRVYRYRLDGEYIETVQVDDNTPISFFGKCEMLNDGEIVCQVHPNMMNVYSVIVLDRSDYSIKRVLSEHYAQNRNARTDISNSSFSVCDEAVSCVKIFSDTLAVYGTDSVMTQVFSRSLPAMPLNMLRQRVDEKNYMGAYYSTNREGKFTTGFGAIYETPRWVYLEFAYKNDPFSGLLWDKKHNRGVRIYRDGVPGNYLWNLRQLSGAEDNLWVKVLTGENIEHFKDRSGKDAPLGWEEFVETYDTENDNPILLLYYMAD